MISAKEAYYLLKKKHPELTIIEASLYDKEWYLFLAVEDPNAKENFSDPFYLVNKNTKEIKPFVPMTNMRKYNESISQHLLSINSFLRE